MRMSRLLMSLMLLLSFFAVTTIGGTAYAFNLQYWDGTQNVGYLGPVVIKSEDWSGGDTYAPNTNFDYSGTANPYLKHQLGDGYGLGHITTFTEDDPSIPGSKILWSEGALPDREELTFVYWNLYDYYASIDGMGSGEIRSKGGYVGVYLDTALDYDDGAQGKSGITPDSPPCGDCIPDYTTVTDGSLFLLLEFTPGVRDGQGDLETTLDIAQDVQTPFAGSSRGYLSVIGGDYDWMFDSDGFTFSDGSTADFYLNFTFDCLDYDTWPSKDWTAESNDDLEGTAVPEPATMLLLGTGLIGLAGFGRKKRFFKK